MDVDHLPAELSSLSTALDELTARITVLADRCRDAKQEGLAGDLYAVERAMEEAGRRLGSVLRNPRR